MPHLSSAQVARIAALAGHENLEVTGRADNFRIVCSCGYESRRRRTPALAAQAGIHHLYKVVSSIDGLVTSTGIPFNRAIESARVKTLKATPPTGESADDTPSVVAS